MTKVVTW